MRRILLCCLLAPAVLAAAPARADDAEDWRLFGNVLAVVQKVLRSAAESQDPEAARKGVDDVLAGRDADANRAAAEVLSEVLRELPPEQRGTFTAIARDVLTIARRENLRAAAGAQDRQTEEALRARKELHAMGLRYWDEEQYQAAVKRGDRIAVELFHAGRGLASRSPR